MPGESRFVGLRLDDLPAVERLQCPDCDFQTPLSATLPKNSLLAHRRNKHENWAEEKRVKPQFLALVEATGSFDLACHFADTVITWSRPDITTLRAWAVDAENAEDDGKPLVSEKQVRRMERRLRRSEEWRSRKVLDSMRNATLKLSNEVAKTGTLDKPQLMQYTGMNVSYMTKEIAAAHGGTTQVRPTMINKLTINAGAPPQRKLREAQVIDAEVKVLDDGNSA